MNPKLLPHIGKLTYSGKCNDYDEDGDLVSSIFSDASDMAYVTDEDREDVITLTREEFKSLLASPQEFMGRGSIFQINLHDGIAWIYNRSEDIHYFYSR